MNEIVPIYKPEGITPLELITRFKDTFPHYYKEKISVAGRLDPMASGLLLLLIGDANKKRVTLQSLNKSYIFTLLLGVTTDTYDILGKITSVAEQSVRYTPEELSHYLTDLKGTFSQEYPPYSSMHVKGKPLFYWAREDKLPEIAIPTKTVTIKSLEILSSELIDKDKLVNIIEQRIKKVEGDFRQEAIIKKWKNSLVDLPSHLQLFSIKGDVSSGTYIRSLCFELGRRSGNGGIAYSIERISCGNYDLKDALRFA